MTVKQRGRDESDGVMISQVKIVANRQATSFCNLEILAIFSSDRVCGTSQTFIRMNGVLVSALSYEYGCWCLGQIATSII